MRNLQEYRRKRNFGATPEPADTAQPSDVSRDKKKSKASPEESEKAKLRGAAAAPHFVVQRHAARRLHFDFRLEVNGALTSWAVPKGPPEERGEKRLAIHVEDHPLSYAKFEGEIPKGNYGAGEVQIWDEGTFELEGDESAAAQIERGDLKFRLTGHRLKGRYALVQMKKSEGAKEWLMIRKDDPDAAGSPGSVAAKPASTKRGENTQIAEASQLRGAIQTAMPERVPVALATLADKPFSSSDWLFEIKWDGERALARVVDGEVEFWSRSGRNITAEYPELRELRKRFNARKAIIDGEIVVLDAKGRSDFSRIQSRFGVLNPSAALQAKSPVTFYAFDLLYCDGYDLRPAALEGRKELLRALLSPSERIRYSDYQVEKGMELYEVAKEQGLEGIIAKQLGSPYPGKRTPLWLKLKLLQDMDVVVGGWTAPRRSRDYFGALLMGLYDGDDLVYIGSVGTGFDREMLESLYKAMVKLETRNCPFQAEPKVPEAVHWVKPAMVARVKYHHWTNDKKLRQPVFMGLQEDRSPCDCTFQSQASPAMEPEALTAAASGAASQEKTTGRSSRKNMAKTAPSKGARERIKSARNNVSDGDDSGGDVPGNNSGETTASKGLEQALATGKEETLAVELDAKQLKLTNLNKIYFPELRLRKRDVLLHYLRIAPCMLPFLKDRPLVLKRYPNGIHGEFFFQKEAPAAHPDWIRTAPIDSKERGGKMPYFLADDTADLLYLTNLGCIDHNPWSSRIADEKHPDYIFFDLDPTEGTKFDVVLTVARAVEKQLTTLGMRFYMKTSGSTGFHIYLPLEPKYTYEQVRLFAGAVGQRVQGELSRLVTPERTVSKRKKGTVLIDALQNARGKPLAAVYSLRPFVDATVSTPVSPRELATGFEPEDFNINTIVPRLKRRGDLWADFWKERQTLESAVDRAR